MDQLNITLNQEEILHLLSNNSGDAFKKNCFRNGSRNRELNTRIGRITLRVPRHRNQTFKTMIFENYSRSEAALIASMAEMVVNGVSTRKVSQVVETLCGTVVVKRFCNICG